MDTLLIADTSRQDTEIEPASGISWATARALILLLIVLILAGWSYPIFQRWKQTSIAVPIEKVRFATVKRTTFVRDISVEGKTVAAVKPVVFSPSAGRVTLLVRAGDLVEKGAKIAQIDSPELSSQQTQEKSTLDALASKIERLAIQARTDQLISQQDLDLAALALASANREMRRAISGLKKGVVSTLDHEKASDDLQRASLQHKHQQDANVLLRENLVLEKQIQDHDFSRQQALVDELSRRIDELSIVSPVSGVVGDLVVNEKDIVRQYQPILAVVNLDEYEVDIEIPERYANSLVFGMRAEIQQDGEHFSANLASVSPEVKDGQVIGRVRFENSRPADLRQNQRVTVRVVIESKKDTMTVSRGDFLQYGGGRTAYLVSDRIATRQVIETGSTSVSEVEILSGLMEGDVIIVSGASYLDQQDQVSLID